MTTKNTGGVDTAIRAVLGTLLMVWAAVFADPHPFLALGAATYAMLSRGGRLVAPGPAQR